MTFNITDDERWEMVRQIGANVWPISGGRIRSLPDGIELPAGAGYVVRVHLTPTDEYVVERVFKRKDKEFVHGTREGVYCDTVGEVAYYASCFRSYDEGEWEVKA